ncbi:hypothetical protein [Streptomyces sp. NBC_01497]|uniref:hypothetical protein n=1 Tax=Streptomyces sp. NBC_01497 TaxID=2903885 RepID=UPI002E30A094|nr:hypothetical protein [Streptomyces sp. NBC_01497]
MSGTGSGRRSAQTLGLVVLTLLLVGLYLVSAFADVHARARTDLSVAIAVLTSLLVLLNRPALRPSASEAVRRSSFVAFTGRLVIVVVWIVQALLFGFSGYFVSSGFQQPGFHGRVALLAAVGQALAVLALCARSMAAFRPDWGFSPSAGKPAPGGRFDTFTVRVRPRAGTGPRALPRHPPLPPPCRRV